MIDFKSMNPRTRCVALVGTYMQEFAFLEFKIHSVITKAMGLNVVQGLILYKNMKYGDKVAACYSIANEDAGNDEMLKAKNKKLFDTLFTIGATRNQIAHTPFHETEDGLAVSFFKVKARGDLEVPPSIWTIEMFEAEFALMDKCRDGLIEIETKIKTDQYRKALIAELLKPQPPRGGLFGQGGIGLLNLPPADTLGYPPQPSSPETATENPPKP